MQYPETSIIIATLNSQKTLADTLASVRKQNYPWDKIEILIIDGGSRDKTIKIARRYGCKILKNPKVDQVYAKYLGWLKSKGKYLLFLDSDEALKNKNSIKDKVLTILNDGRIKVVISSGYENSGISFRLNNYVNEFGDPFSYFMYRISKAEKYFLEELKKKGRIVYDHTKAVVFDFSNEADPPFIELTSMGVLIDREYVKSNTIQVFKNISVYTHLFYLLNSMKCLFAVMKHDPIVHKSVYSLFSFLKKINSRIKNNIFKTNMGKAGFVGREKYQSSRYRLMKFLFIPYNLLVLPVLMDSLLLLVRKRQPVYLMHMVLSFYTLLSIMYYSLIKLTGIKVKLTGYGT